MNEFPTLADAMSYLAQKLMTEGSSVAGVTEPSSVGSQFGSSIRATKELVGFSFTITDPRAVLIDRPARPINLGFALSNILWTVSGSNRVADIAFWNSRALHFSDNQQTIRSALGPRLFTKQFRSAMDRLRSDPTTRRAFLSLISASDVTAKTRDVPCVVGLHLMIRDSKLMAVAMMRSQSALMVLPYDVPLLAALQCIAAAELEIAPGPFTHISSSLHFYDDEVELAKQVADGCIASVSVPDIPRLEEMKELALLESRLRRASTMELKAMASDLIAEPKSHHYATVVQASLLIQLLAKHSSLELTHDLARLAGRVGELAIQYQHGIRS
jgi:thymidylate synthase